MLKIGQAILTRISLPFCLSYSFLCTVKRNVYKSIACKRQSHTIFLKKQYLSNRKLFSVFA